MSVPFLLTAAQMRRIRPHFLNRAGFAGGSNR
jgi:hypothetical protein